MVPRQREQHPNEPWLWRADWAERAVRETPEVGGWCLWGFAILWNLFSIPVFFFVEWRWPMDAKSILLAAFPIAGALVVLLAVYHSLRRGKYGLSVCRIDRVPIPLGSTLRGEIDVRMHELPRSGFALRLACVRRTVTGSGKNRSVHESILWQDEQTVAHGAMPGPNGLRVPFRFDIPFDGEPASLVDPSDLVLWKLTASAEVPGIDYEATFELPVFRVEGAQDELAPRVHSPMAWQPPPEITIAANTIVIRPPYGISAFVVPTIFFAIFFGALALIRKIGAPLFAIVFFGAVAAFIALVILDLLLGRTTLAADRMTLTSRRTWLGLGRHHAIPAAEIERFEPVLGTTIGNTAYHDVRVVLRSGRTRRVAKYIRTRRDAEMLGERLAQMLGA